MSDELLTANELESLQEWAGHDELVHRLLAEHVALAAEVERLRGVLRDLAGEECPEEYPPETQS